MGNVRSWSLKNLLTSLILHRNEFDLTDIEFFRRLFKHRAFQWAVIIPNLFIFIIVVIAGFVGTPVGNANFAVILVWIVWWFALMTILTPLFSRLWCMICPLPAFGDWLQRRGFIKKQGGFKFLGLNKPWPAPVKNLWPVNFIFLFVATFILLLTTRPVVTSILLLTLFVLGTVLALPFAKRAFCRYICPVGGFLGLYSMFASFELRPKDRTLCDHHVTKECIRGSDTSFGCPWLIYPGGLERNNFCGLCMECIKACPYNNLAVRIRRFGKDLLAKTGRALDEVYKAHIMLALAVIYREVGGQMKDKVEKARCVVDWSSLWRKEDWLAVWLGFITLSAAAAGVIKWIPKIQTWATDITAAFPRGSEYFVVVLLGLLALAALGVAAMEGRVKRFMAGFPIIFFLSFLSFLLAAQRTIGKDYGLEFALWALLLGLLVSNTVGVPSWLQAAAKTELFIKIGLVLLGAEILFQRILAAGVYGMLQALIVVTLVFYFCYFISTRVFKIDRQFASVSICGVSAAIAAGGAVKGDPKQVSYTISLILLLAIPMLIFMPAAAKAIGLNDAVAGAWLGGTIDTTPAVVAAGALYSKQAMEVASIVKMSQNVLIGVWAFALALYFATKVERAAGEVRPSLLEIWYRFPKFILGFIASSLIFSLLLTPTLGVKQVDATLSITSSLRSWWFAMAFVSIGLNTNFLELIKVGRGRPFVAFSVAQLFNIALTLIIAHLVFGGILLPSPY
ncbi:MAG: putative sulfate exporter family transporter [Thaumarchaeota archaeon]|nr:putative sulfate exporter family transporter [Nitrososphaerota archaeon]